jgi:hypothetical protein
MMMMMMMKGRELEETFDLRPKMNSYATKACYNSFTRLKMTDGWMDG